jgi:L-seryl-tRNA(Ser) seleniumtransferase
MTLAVLEATLRLFLNEETAKQDVPTIKMLLRPYESIQRQAARIVTKLRKSKLACEIKTIDGHSQTGSGSLPTQNMPTRLVTISSDAINSDTLAGRLRQHEVPIFTRIQDEKVLIDPRTLLDGDEKIIIDALTEILDANP